MAARQRETPITSHPLGDMQHGHTPVEEADLRNEDGGEVEVEVKEKGEQVEREVQEHPSAVDQPRHLPTERAVPVPGHTSQSTALPPHSDTHTEEPSSHIPQPSVPEPVLSAPSNNAGHEAGQQTAMPASVEVTGDSDDNGPPPPLPKRSVSMASPSRRSRQNKQKAKRKRRKKGGRGREAEHLQRWTEDTEAQALAVRIAQAHGIPALTSVDDVMFFLAAMDIRVTVLSVGCLPDSVTNQDGDVVLSFGTF